MRSSAMAAMVLAVLVGLACVSNPVAGRYLPTKRGADSERLDRIVHLIREILAESDAAPPERAAYDQRLFFKREAPLYEAQQAKQLAGPGLQPAQH